MHPVHWKRLQRLLLPFILLGLFWSSTVQANSTGSPPTTRPATRPTLAPKGLPGTVYLKLNELHKLLQRSRVGFTPGVVPQEANYTGRLYAQQLILKARLRVHVVKKGVVRWNLGGRGGVLTGLQVNRQPTAPFRDASGKYSVLLRSGGNEVTYTYQLPVRKKRGGKHTLFLDLPAVTRGQMTLTFRGDGWELTTQPSSRISTRILKKQTQFHLDLPATGGVMLKWKGKRIERKVKTRFRAEVETLVTLQEGLLSGNSRIYYQVLTGALRSLQFKAPKEIEILGVKGQSVTEWYQIKQDKKWRWYSVQLSRAVSERHTLKVRFEKTKLKANAPIALYSPVVPEAEIFHGILGVLTRADTEVSHHSSSKALSLDVRNLSARIRKQSERPILLAYRFEQADFSIRVNVTRHKKVKVLSILVNRAEFQTVLTPHGREVVRALYHVTNNQRQFMQIDLPRGSRLLGTFVAGQPVQPARSSRQPGAAQPTMARIKAVVRYLIPLIRSSRSQNKRSFQVELFYTRKRRAFQGSGSMHVVLPSTPLEIMRFTWYLYTPTDFPVLWRIGNVREGYRRRFLSKLERRVFRDLRSATPDLWAGGKARRSQLNVYSSLGLKQRFALPSLTSKKAASRRLHRLLKDQRYKSSFDMNMRQIRLQLPLVGRAHYFRGHLFRGKAPFVHFYYVKKSVVSVWFWIVLACSLLLGFLFSTGLFFHPRGIRWLRLLGIIVLWAVFCVIGYLLPMTYLGLLKGALFGFWAACLVRLSNFERDRYKFPSVYLTVMRWWAVFLTFMMLMADNPGTQIASLILALPVYPALMLKKSNGNTSSENHSKEEEAQ